jgi:hypothetical protein
MYGFDTDSHLNLDDAKKAYSEGARFVPLYLHNDLTVDILIAHEAGLGIALIWETAARRSLSGAEGGAQDGKAAQQAVDALNAPSGTAVVVTDDGDTTALEQPDVLAYMRAFRECLTAPIHLIGYANGAVCLAALEVGIIDEAWLLGGDGTRGYDDAVNSGKMTIIQAVGDQAGLYLSIAIDSDEASILPAGLWMPDGSVSGSTTPTPIPPPAPQPKPQPATPTLGETLQFGSEGPDVVVLQKRLMALGYNIGPDGADGFWGSDTQHAVQVFQYNNHLIEDGIIMPTDPDIENSGQTWKALWS